MKQISNWVFGSFFRTIGRLLVFVLLGVLIANFVDFGSLKDNFSITNLLGIETIKAATNVYSGYISNAYGQNGNAFSNSDTGIPDSFKFVVGTSSDSSTNIYFNSSASTGGTGLDLGSNNQFSEVIFLVAFQSKSSGGLQIVRSVNAMATYSRNGSQYGVVNCYFSGELDMNFNTENTSGGNIVYYNLHCPITSNGTNNKIYMSRLRISTLEGGSTFNFFAVGRNYNIIRDSNQDLIQQQQETQNAINSQTQQQQQQHNETQSYLEDSNTTQAENEASDFFSDFEVEDHGGLSGIITAPLSTIQSLLNNTCTNLVLPLPFVNENLTLPCMNSIYTEHFGAFFTIYQTIILAIISYRCLRSLFYDVRGFINPDDDRIEVMDL